MALEVALEVLECARDRDFDRWDRASASASLSSWILASASLKGYRLIQTNTNMHGGTVPAIDLTEFRSTSMPPNNTSDPSQSNLNSVCSSRPPGTPCAEDRL